MYGLYCFGIAHLYNVMDLAMCKVVPVVVLVCDVAVRPPTDHSKGGGSSATKGGYGGLSNKWKRRMNTGEMEGQMTGDKRTVTLR